MTNYQFTIILSRCIIISVQILISQAKGQRLWTENDKMSVAIVSQGLPRQLSALCVPRHCPLLLPSVTTYFHCFLSEVPLVPTFAYSPVSSFRTRRKHLHFSKGCLSRTPQSVCLSFFAITAPTVTSTEKFSTLKAIGIT